MRSLTPGVRAVAALLCVAAAPLFASAAKTAIPFTLVNNSDHTMSAVHISKTAESRWGANLLNGHHLPPGASVHLEIAGDCGTYDLRLVAEDQIEFFDDELEFCDDGDVVTLQHDEVIKTKASS